MVGIILKIKIMILNYFIYYILAGFVFTFLVDVACDVYKVDRGWGIIERVFCTLLWPFCIILVLQGAWNSNNKWPKK